MDRENHFPMKNESSIVNKLDYPANTGHLIYCIAQKQLLNFQTPKQNVCDFNHSYFELVSIPILVSFIRLLNTIIFFINAAVQCKVGLCFMCLESFTTGPLWKKNVKI